MTEKLTKTEAVGQLAELAKEVEIKDPIDWGMLNITEQQAYEMMASNVLDQMYSVPDGHRETVALATITKLLVENFVLNLQLHGKNEKENADTNSN